MSDFWKKFKGVFVVEDPNTPQQSKSASSVPVTESKESVSNNATVENIPTPIINVGSGQVNEKFMEVLFKAMEGVNQEGFDYFEYKQSLNNLQSMPMDEPTRYKSAYAMAQTMGASAEKLINTALVYLNALKSEETKFNQAAENQRQNLVGNRQSQIENFDAVIKQKAEQIKKLTQEIDQHKAEMVKLKDEIETSAVKVEQTKRDFNTTYSVLVSQIQQDITNMKNYLK